MLTYAPEPEHAHKQFYIGQKGRTFSKRLSEHLLKPKIDEKRSKFSRHLIDQDHSYKHIQDNLNSLHKCGKGHLLNTREQFEIYKAIKIQPQLCF